MISDHCLLYHSFKAKYDPLQEQAISKGIDPGAASLLFSSMGVGGFIGRVGMGLVCDTVTRRLGEDKVVYTIIIGNIINGLGETRHNHDIPTF